MYVERLHLLHGYFKSIVNLIYTPLPIIMCQNSLIRILVSLQALAPILSRTRERTKIEADNDDEIFRLMIRL